MSFDHSALPKKKQRNYLPGKFDAANSEQLKKFFDELQSRSIGSTKDIEKWLWDESEFASALSEEQAYRYIRMSCQTDDVERETAYLFFVENIEPQIKMGFAELDRKYVDSPVRKQLPREKYSVLGRKRENSIALFRKENVELEKEEAKLWQKYEKIVGAMTVMYDGQEKTMQQLGRYQEETKRNIREDTWLLGEKRRRKDHDEIDGIYDELIRLREKIAKNAGYGNYRDYIFPRRERFDYTPEDCFSYHKAVEEYIVPLIRDLDKQRVGSLELDELRPWDLSVDPEGKPPLHPFKTAPELVKGCIQIFEKVNPRFANYLMKMQELNLLDLESRKGKAPGGYSQEMAEVQLPFIFMNAVGRDGDVWTLLHEAGHSFHSFLTREQDLLYH
ncbi:MAG TPA: M3 family metallopeptidase, partial [Candidatus Binatus sp.]|nr:M3 family metallopeptidase [Candidatus Binatus sp.]